VVASELILILEHLISSEVVGATVHVSTHLAHVVLTGESLLKALVVVKISLVILVVLLIVSDHSLKVTVELFSTHTFPTHLRTRNSHTLVNTRLWYLKSTTFEARLARVKLSHFALANGLVLLTHHLGTLLALTLTLIQSTWISASLHLGVASHATIKSLLHFEVSLLLETTWLHAIGHHVVFRTTKSLLLRVSLVGKRHALSLVSLKLPLLSRLVHARWSTELLFSSKHAIRLLSFVPHEIISLSLVGCLLTRLKLLLLFFLELVSLLFLSRQTDLTFLKTVILIRRRNIVITKQVFKL
jgi:hypothetical protein